MGSMFGITGVSMVGGDKAAPTLGWSSVGDGGNCWFLRASEAVRFVYIYSHQYGQSLK